MQKKSWGSTFTFALIVCALAPCILLFMNYQAQAATNDGDESGYELCQVSPFVIPAGAYSGTYAVDIDGVFKNVGEKYIVSAKIHYLVLDAGMQEICSYIIEVTDIACGSAKPFADMFLTCSSVEPSYFENYVEYEFGEQQQTASGYSGVTEYQPRLLDSPDLYALNYLLIFENTGCDIQSLRIVVYVTHGFGLYTGRIEVTFENVKSGDYIDRADIVYMTVQPILESFVLLVYADGVLL